jgi:hypothetical protein
MAMAYLSLSITRYKLDKSVPSREEAKEFEEVSMEVGGIGVKAGTQIPFPPHAKKKLTFIATTFMQMQRHILLPISFSHTIRRQLHVSQLRTLKALNTPNTSQRKWLSTTSAVYKRNNKVNGFGSGDLDELVESGKLSSEGVSKSNFVSFDADMWF